MIIGISSNLFSLTFPFTSFVQHPNPFNYSLKKFHQCLTSQLSSLVLFFTSSCNFFTLKISTSNSFSFRLFQNKKAIYALVLEALQHETQIDFLFRKSQILVKEDRLDIWLARILVTELLWGKKKLPGDSKPIKTILGYQQIFNAHLDEVHTESKKLLNKSGN